MLLGGFARGPDVYRTIRQMTYLLSPCRVRLQPLPASRTAIVHAVAPRCGIPFNFSRSCRPSWHDECFRLGLGSTGVSPEVPGQLAPVRCRPADSAQAAAPKGHRRIDNDRLQEATKVNSTERKERRGFASLSPERQKEIASKGGRAAHAKGTAHEWTPEEARSAGRKGGQVSRGGRGRLPSDPVGVEAPFQNE